MGRQVRHTLLDSGTFFVAELDDVLTGVAGWVEDSRESWIAPGRVTSLSRQKPAGSELAGP